MMKRRSGRKMTLIVTLIVAAMGIISIPLIILGVMGQNNSTTIQQDNKTITQNQNQTQNTNINSTDGNTSATKKD